MSDDAAASEFLEREVTEWTDAELLAELTRSYSPPEVPPCRICGAPLTVQRSGGGQPTVWGCDGRGDDFKFQPGRRLADDHYTESRWLDSRRGGDDRVLELIRRYNENS